MSLYGLSLSNPSMDSIPVLHMERTYIGAVQRGIIFLYILKIEKSQKLLQLVTCFNNIFMFTNFAPVSHGLI